MSPELTWMFAVVLIPIAAVLFESGKPSDLDSE